MSGYLDESADDVMDVVGLPETAEEFAAAAANLRSVGEMIASSPGAQAQAQVTVAEGVRVVGAELDARAANMRDRNGNPVAITNHVAAWQDAERLAQAAQRAGDTMDEARDWALDAAAKRATKTETYADIVRRFQATSHGQRIEPERRAPGPRVGRQE